MVEEIKICKYKKTKTGDWKIGIGVNTSRGFHIYDTDFVLEKTVYDIDTNYVNFNLNIGLLVEKEIEKLNGEDIVKAYMYSNKGDVDYRVDKDSCIDSNCSLFNKNVIQFYANNIIDGSYRFILYQDDMEISNRIVKPIKGIVDIEFKTNENIRFSKGTCFRFELLDKDKIVISAEYKYDR